MSDSSSIRIKNPDITISYFSSLHAAADIFLERRETGVALVALNAEKIIKIRSQHEVYSNLKNTVFYPDGASICWLNSSNYPRIPGVELWLEILSKIQDERCKVIIIGGQRDVSSKSLAKLSLDFPKLAFTAIDGYQSNVAYTNIVRTLKPDFVFVAMGSPKQEALMAELQGIQPHGFFMGIGGSLDILSGKVKRAPEIFRNNGLEFLYRLITNPKRIVRQVILLRFVYDYIFNNFYKENLK